MTAGDVPTVLVWGTGSIGCRHLQILRDHGIASPIALSARSKRTLEAPLADIPTVSSLEEAIQRGAVAAIIATNTSHHVEGSLRAARAGLRLLIEKPLAVDARESEVLRRELDARSTEACVGYCLRFHPALATFREHLSRIGHVHHVSIACQSYLVDWRPHADHRVGYSARAAEGGVLRDLSHELDYARFLFGTPRSVTAVLSSTGRLELESEECADMTWSMGDDTTIAFRLDYLTRTTKRTMTAFGALGELFCDLVSNQVSLQMAGQPPCSLPTAGVDRDTVLAQQARAFLQGPTGPDWSTLASVADGAHVMAICDAARRASETGSSQPLTELERRS